VNEVKEMTIARHDPTTFRARLGRGDILAGTFIKTPAGHAVEIMGDLGLDFVVIDEEHAPFDRQAIDQALVSARAGRIAALVRVASAAPSNLLSVLDCGAAGVLVPHVDSVGKARDVIASCRYQNGRRGFSNSPRAGRYGGLTLGEHVRQGDAAVVIVAQIEDPHAIAQAEAIGRLEGIDALFIGRGDLAVAMGEASPDAPAVRKAAEDICAAGKAAGKPVMVFVGNAADARAMRAIGASAFIYSSDQGLMRQAAARAQAEIMALT
jgi:2-keto-3-deoxy-L-rhamnonate aldolase RhmA